MIGRGPEKTFVVTCDGCQAQVSSPRSAGFKGALVKAKSLKWKVEYITDKEVGHFCPSC